jgi:polyhydroxyalkanoate synthesis regulator phasin
MNEFNFFRINCLLADQQASTLNSVIISIVNELIFLQENSWISRADCIEKMGADFNLNVEVKFLQKILEKSKNFQFKSISEDVLIKFRDEKYSALLETINTLSIETYINIFIEKHNIEKKRIITFQNLLYEAIYNNITSFSTDNLKTLVKGNFLEQYTKLDIEQFNQFLEWDNDKKNHALFILFLKAIEFAILTSGTGVKEISKEIFTGKEYLLDANIIFRLIGIGGKERRESISSLIIACIHQGIKFQYSMATYSEVMKKIESSVVEIGELARDESIKTLQKMINDNPSSFNDDFLVHYCHCVNSKGLNSAANYELFLRAEFRKLEERFNLMRVPCKDNLNKIQLNNLTLQLYNKKKEYMPRVRYNKKAAEVDAVNILQVKKLRGANDLNYSDVKSFYLTTDRLLNQILSNEEKSSLTETILPSQLFILHNGFFSDGKNVDFNSFVKFLKRRTTEYKLYGKEVINYIEEIREYTTDEENIVNIIKSYSDKKYETTLASSQIEPEYKPIKEYAKTYMDDVIGRAKDDQEEYKKIYKNAIDNIPSIFRASRKLTQIIYIAIFIVSIPIIYTLSRFFLKELIYIIPIVIIVELIKLSILEKTKSLKKIWLWAYDKKVKRSSYYRINPSDKKYENYALQYFNDNAISVWSK